MAENEKPILGTGAKGDPTNPTATGKRQATKRTQGPAQQDTQQMQEPAKPKNKTQAAAQKQQKGES